jgi:hypothetical protein
MVMDRTYIDSNHVVPRYLSDQLAEAERQAFEAYVLKHPEIVTELEATARLKVGLAELHAHGEIASIPAADTRKVLRLTGLAASVLVLATTVFWFSHAPKAPAFAASLESLAQVSGRAPTLAATHTLLRVRGTAADAVIAVAPPGQAVELRVLPEIEAHPARYRAAMLAVSASGETKVIASIGGLLPNDEGLVVVFVEPGRLGTGRYRLSIAGDSGTDAANATSTFGIAIAAP